MSVFVSAIACLDAPDAIHCFRLARTRACLREACVFRWPLGLTPQLVSSLFFVVVAPQGERNFHILYELAAGGAASGLSAQLKVTQAPIKRMCSLFLPYV